MHLSKPLPSVLEYKAGRSLQFLESVHLQVPLDFSQFAFIEEPAWSGLDFHP